MSALTETRKAMVAAGRRRERTFWTLAAVALIVAPQILHTGFAISIMTQMAISIIFALSYNMLLGQGGMLSFGHAVYFGLGGFLAMHAMNMIGGGRLPLPVPLLPLIGGVIGLLFGYLFGSFSTRRAGTVFAMISLGLAELIAASGLILDGFFGGEEGVSSNRTGGMHLFGLTLGPDIQVYYVAAFWTLVAAFLMYRFSRTPAGRMANAVRDNPERAEFIGYSQRNVRLLSFCMAGFFAGLAGGMFAITYEIVTADTLSMNQSGTVLLMTYIGGVGYFVGPVIGAIVMTLLSTVLSNVTDLWMLYVGLLFVATVLYVPTGLAGLITMHAPAWRAGRLQRLFVPYCVMAVPIAAAFIGLTSILELAHFAQTTAEDTRVDHLYHMALNIDKPVSWIGLVVLSAAGLAGIFLLRPMLMRAWADANDKA